MKQRVARFAFLHDTFSRWDALAILLVIGMTMLLAEASRGLLEPLTQLTATALPLDPAHLPEYAARTTLRMFAALALSLLFTLTYATWAAKSERAGQLLIPILDILQSVPILGFISITAVFFMSLAPGRVLGAELAAIFAIFTSQAWNMAFSFYQSLRTVPKELREASDSFLLSPWVRFWRLEVPFAMPALVWNMMMSMSGGWFFVVASEAITVGDTSVMLPGMGSYIALAIEKRDFAAIGWAIATMFLVVLLYDQLLFRPLVAWVDRFRVEQEPGTRAPESWVLTMARRSRLIRWVTVALRAAVHFTARPRPASASQAPHVPSSGRGRSGIWLAMVIAGAGLALWQVASRLIPQTSVAELVDVCGAALLTMVRVFVLIGLATLLWLPIGVWIGLRPRVARIAQPIAQFLAAFPANLLFPVAVFAILKWHLNANVWLSPLMILGTQWYILFNVIAGASAMPSELRYAARNLQVRGWLWWQKVAIPAVLPYYLTGAITASGGSWNASIVAEVATWGDTRLQAKGLGAYIAAATAAGDFHRIALGIVTMSVFVVTINRLTWRPLYLYAERKLRIA